MNQISIKEDEVIVFETDLLIHPRELQKVREEIFRQAKTGVIVVPSGFRTAIIKRDLLQEGEEWAK